MSCDNMKRERDKRLAGQIVLWAPGSSTTASSVGLGPRIEAALWVASKTRPNKWQWRRRRRARCECARVERQQAECSESMVSSAPRLAVIASANTDDEQENEEDDDEQRLECRLSPLTSLLGQHMEKRKRKQAQPPCSHASSSQQTRSATSGVTRTRTRTRASLAPVWRSLNSGALGLLLALLVALAHATGDQQQQQQQQKLAQQLAFGVANEQAPNELQSNNNNNAGPFGWRLGSPSAVLADTSNEPETDANQPEPDEKLFAKRQGQAGAQAEPTLQEDQPQLARRQAMLQRQPAGFGAPMQQPPQARPPNRPVQSQLLQQQQQQGERFQRLRSQQQANGNNNPLEQFPRPQMGPQQQQQGQQPPGAALQLGLPTLSAFDLSSLANLANNRPGAQQQQQQQGQQLPQAAFRRLQPQPPLRANSNFQSAAQFGGQQLPPAPPPPQQVNPQTELPFIRQVFRPAPANEDQFVRAQSSGGRPAPPPLYVPGRQQQPQQPQTPRNNARPLSATPQLESGGFAPIQSSAPQSPAAAFFEPAQRAQSQAASFVRTPSAQPQAQLPQPTRKPVARRPGQRPQVPQTMQQQQQQRAPLPLASQDVIRLASTAVQTANEAVAVVSLATPSPSSATLASSGELSTGGPRAAETSTSSSSSSPFNTGATADLTTTTTVTSAPEQRRRATAPLRTSANFFTSSQQQAGGSSTPASLVAGGLSSPSLPINIAVAASGGGRRRIPVRGQQLAAANQAGSRVAPLTTTTTTTTTTPPSTSATTWNAGGAQRASTQPPGFTVRRPEADEFYETITSGQQGHQLGLLANSAGIEGFGAASSSERPPPTTTTDMYGSRLNANVQDQLRPIEAASERPPPPVASSEEPASRAPASPEPQAINQQQAVMVPVTYITTLSYLTTVLHGTHTLETSHERIERSTKLATLNAQLMDQIEHRLPLIEPTATVALSSKTKGRGTTMINLKSAVSAYNQELVEALGGAGSGGPTVQPSAVPVQASSSGPASNVALQQEAELAQVAVQKQGARVRVSRTLDLRDLQEAKKQLVTEYVYAFTIWPQETANGGQAPVAASSLLRTELVPGATLDARELMEQLAGQQQASLIDSNGMLRIGAEQQQSSGASNQIALGSTIGKETPAMVTQVAMSVATYVKFESISNALLNVESLVRPTKLASLDSSQSLSEFSADSRPQAAQRARGQLETSFDVHMTLGNALEQLQQPNNGQQQQQQLFATPTLDQAIRQTVAQRQQQEDLLRSSSAVSTTANEASSIASERASSTSLARSLARSRIASSRFRSQLQTLQPARASSPSAVTSSVAVTPPSEQVAPSGSLGSQRARLVTPNRSRLARPQTKLSGSEISSGSSSSTELATSLASSSGPSVRATRPRFVVVTRTGQFGIRASAISSLAAAAAASSSSNQEQANSSSSSGGEQAVAPSTTVVPVVVRVSSRFAKPNRFRGASQSIQVTGVPVGQLLAVSSSVITPSGSTQPQPVSTITTTTTTTTTTATSAPTTTDQTTGQRAGSSSEQPPATTSKPEASRNTQEDYGGALKPDQSNGAAPVVVTYFTTTTHTIPFELNSETVFTTIEETNSRIATEFLSDLGSQLVGEPSSTQSIVPSATASLPATQTEAPSSPLPTTSEQPSRQETTTTTTTPSSEPATGTTQATSDEQARPTPPIDPTFVVSLNTKTYFTTFTYFTTYAAGESSQSIKSSESTTSNVVTETVSETLASGTAYSPSQATTVAHSETLSSVAVASSSPNVGSQLEPTKTFDGSTGTTVNALLPTTTYYGTTVYSGTQSSPTTTVDISTQSVTVTPGASEQPAFNLNSDLLASSARPQVFEQASINSQRLAEQEGDKITRTRSMYTTLTHFITFYSGTKTQLSTIQEISPTVVTEYLDRTQFEQQQASSEASSVQVVVPTSAPSVEGNQLLVRPTLTLAPLDQATVSLSGGGPPSASEPPIGSTTSPSQSSSTEQTNTLASITLKEAEQESGASGAQQQQQQDQARVLASSAGESGANANQDKAPGAAEEKQTPNIIELSDLIAANSSQSGRVALAGNLGAAIKDIVQLLAGNRTLTTSGTVPTVSLPPTTSATSQSEQTGDSVQTTTSASQATSSTTTKRPTRVFGSGAASRNAVNLQGSIGSPAGGSQDGQQTEATKQATPELTSAIVVAPSQHSTTRQAATAAATIFFGDDGGDERKKAIKTVWPGAQSSLLVTSVEPSTRSLVVTTTKVYFTRDSPITITSSFTTLIAPRTFVSTIAGTRTMVNQLNTASQSSSSIAASSTLPLASSSASPAAAADKSRQPSRQDSQASSHRLTIQGKQQRQQAALEQQQKKQQQQREQLAAAAANKSKADAAAKQQLASAQANINQCAPACKQSANEVCKFTPHSDTAGAQGTFACACRPGYQMQANQVGQRQCVEVQSFVVLLRLLQVGDQQVAFKRELNSKAAPEFKQLARLVREHVKRAYMSSELTRDRFVSAEVGNFARSLSSQRALASKQSTLSNVSQSVEPLGGAGVIVNMTVHLAPAGAQSDTSVQLDELTLKEELTKRLSMRQAAALAAAAAAASASGAPASQAQAATTQEQAQADQQTNGTNSIAIATLANQTALVQDEALPNPSALFLADVEQVQDLDECASAQLNDCHEAAVCINEPGSYRCDCRDWPDLNPLNAGRQCANELKSCDYCNNRGDCQRVPSLLLGGAAALTANSSSQTIAAQAQRPPYNTVCQCHRIYLGRRCEINGLLLATLLPIFAILLIVSVCLVIYCCRRWRKRSAMSKGFRNIGMLGGTLDRKAMLESSSESSDTHQRPHHLHHAAHLLHQHHAAAAAAAAAGRTGGLYDATSAAAAAIAAHLPPSDMTAGSSSAESSPRQMVRSQAGGSGAHAHHLHHHHHHQHATSAAGGLIAANSGQASAGSATSGATGTAANSLGSIPQQIVIPRARHNQVNYAVHRGQVYMW